MSIKRHEGQQLGRKQVVTDRVNQLFHLTKKINQRVTIHYSPKRFWALLWTILGAWSKPWAVPVPVQLTRQHTGEVVCTVCIVCERRYQCHKNKTDSSVRRMGHKVQWRKMLASVRRWHLGQEICRREGWSMPTLYLAGMCHGPGLQGLKSCCIPRHTNPECTRPQCLPCLWSSGGQFLSSQAVMLGQALESSILSCRKVQNIFCASLGQLGKRMGKKLGSEGTKAFSTTNENSFPSELNKI